MKKTIKIIQNVYKEYCKKNVATLSSSLAYYLTLTLVPSMIAVKSITASFSEETFDGLAVLVPEKLRGFFEHSSIKDEKEIVAVSVLLSLYSLVKSLKALKTHLDFIYGKSRPRNLLYSLAFSLFVSLWFLSLVFLCGVTVLFGENIKKLPPFLRKPLGIYPTVLTHAFAFVFLLCVYRFLPDRKLSIKNLMPGTFFSLAMWGISTWFFSFYLNNFPNRSLVYDSLTSVAALMLWLYVLSSIVLTGACINLLFCDGKAFREAER